MIKKTVLTLSALTGATIVVLGGGVTQSASAHVACGHSWSNITQTLAIDNFNTSGVNIRTGNSTSCTSVGQGQPTHDTVLHCYEPTSTYSWTHLYDQNIARNGFVRNDFLDFVSGNRC